MILQTSTSLYSLACTLDTRSSNVPKSGSLSRWTSSQCVLHLITPTYFYWFFFFFSGYTHTRRDRNTRSPTSYDHGKDCCIFVLVFRSCTTHRRSPLALYTLLSLAFTCFIIYTSHYTHMLTLLLSWFIPFVVFCICILYGWIRILANGEKWDSNVNGVPELSLTCTEMDDNAICDNATPGVFITPTAPTTSCDVAYAWYAAYVKRTVCIVVYFWFW